MIDQLLKTFSTTINSWLLIGGCFWFLNILVDNIANPDLVAIDAGTLGIIVGGLISILSMAANSIFQEAAARSAARTQQAAYDTGLATPTPTPTPPESPEP
jgi:hypothetical protein